MAAGPPPALPELEEGFDLEARGEEFYRHYLALALARAGGVQVRAAEMLGMSFRSFRYYAKKYGLRGGTTRAADDARPARLPPLLDSRH